MLTHLREPEAALAAWAEAAGEGAVLALEETAAMACPHPAFVRYYQLVDQLQASYGQRMRVGQTLSPPPDAAGRSSSTCRCGFRCRRRRWRLHALNLASWRHDAYARAAFAGTEIDALAPQLNAVAAGTEAAPPVSMVMRQLVLVRSGLPITRANANAGANP